MSEQLATTEVALWQELRKYLVTETEISESEISTAYADRGEEVIHLKVTFRNMAPEEPDWPRILFTGVGLGIVSLKNVGSNEPKWAIRSRIQRPDSNTPRSSSYHMMVGADQGKLAYEFLTGDERSHGIALFPGESAIVELTIPVADIPKYELYIEGSVSRRHFFHYQQALRIPLT